MQSREAGCCAEEPKASRAPVVSCDIPQHKVSPFWPQATQSAAKETTQQMILIIPGLHEGDRNSFLSDYQCSVFLTMLIWAAIKLVTWALKVPSLDKLGISLTP